ncbi:MAG: hypothetical protein JW818_00245 [Pirellulales bacterium]|nr:hypothetical protein [Pirellulales bacterium]
MLKAFLKTDYRGLAAYLRDCPTWCEAIELKKVPRWTRFNHARYGQRWQVETVVSMIKRHLGSTTAGRTYHSRRRDLLLMVLTHNTMVLYPLQIHW